MWSWIVQSKPSFISVYQWSSSTRNIWHFNVVSNNSTSSAGIIRSLVPWTQRTFTRSGLGMRRRGQRRLATLSKTCGVRTTADWRPFRFTTLITSQPHSLVLLRQVGGILATRRVISNRGLSATTAKSFTSPPQSDKEYQSATLAPRN